MVEVKATNETILVVGGGISGLTAALDAVECGKEVILVEKEAIVGGMVTQFYKYFPKLCSPGCGLEIQLQRLRTAKNVHLLTLTEVVSIKGQAGAYQVELCQQPRFINRNCTTCGDCLAPLQQQFPQERNHGLQLKEGGSRLGIHLPHAQAYPFYYLMDPTLVGTEDGEAAVKACQYDAIDFSQKEKTFSLDVGAIVWATGWKPYDPTRIQPYGYQRLADVITNIEFERLCDPSGPTGGKIIRLSNGKVPKRVAFIQCAGSRDQNHLKYCSRVCCMVSFKQAAYIRELLGDSVGVSIYYVDLRAQDRNDDFLQKIQADPRISFTRSKVTKIGVGKEERPKLKGMNTETGIRYNYEYDLVVLATGMNPNIEPDLLPESVEIDEYGFLVSGDNDQGFFGTGCVTEPLDVSRSVQQGTAAALRAAETITQMTKTEE